MSRESPWRARSILAIVLVAGAFPAAPEMQGPSREPQLHDSIVLFPVAQEERTNEGALRDRVKDYLARDPRIRTEQRRDLIVIFTDESGQAILPDSAAEGRMPEALARPLEKNLSFTFDSLENPWTPEELALLSTSLADFYPVARRIYGPPAFDITVNVRKDPTIPMAGLYFVSSNEMILRSASIGTLDVLCHEMIHAFRDDYMISLAAYEEGMARAAEVEVFNQLPAYVHPFDEAHGYDYDVYYEALNLPEIGAAGGNLSDGYVSLLLRYQLAGYAWAKPLIEDDRFLSRFNRTYYRRVKADPATRYTEALLLKIAATVQSHVEGAPFRVWYARQHVLDTTPPVGFALYQRVNQFTIDFFERSPSGFVAKIPDVLLTWSVLDHEGMLLDAGSAITTPNGNITFNPVIPSGYSGRLEIVASALTPDGQPIENHTFRPFISGPSGEAGIFGIVVGENEGTVVLQSVARPWSRAVVPVVNGVFSAPALETIRGEFIGVFLSEGTRPRLRVFTKDASRYFVRF